MRRGLRLGASVTSVQGAPGKVVKLSLRRHYPGQVQRVFRTAETLSPQNRAPRTAWRMACGAGGSRQGTDLAAAGAHPFTVAERAVGAPRVSCRRESVAGPPRDLRPQLPRDPITVATMNGSAQSRRGESQAMHRDPALSVASNRGKIVPARASTVSARCARRSRRQSCFGAATVNGFGVSGATSVRSTSMTCPAESAANSTRTQWVSVVPSPKDE